MVEELKDVNEFVYAMAFEREAEEGGLAGWQVFMLLCGKNPWYSNNRQDYTMGVLVENLDVEDLALLEKLENKCFEYRTEEVEGNTSIEALHSIRFWLRCFYRRGIKIGSPAYEKLAGSKAAVSATVGKWPWGSHETNELRILAEAADKFWKNYDPDDKTTAPTNEDVKSWLMAEKGLSNRKADAIASMLRADDVPAGRRPT